MSNFLRLLLKMLLLVPILILLGSSANLCEGTNNNTLDRIVGGVDIDIGYFPWQVSIERYYPNYGWYHICGGSIISNYYILTAAHCMYACAKGQKCIYVPPQNLRIRAGVTIKQSTTTGYQLRNVYGSSPHPSYNADSPTHDYDIGIMSVFSAFYLPTSGIKTVLMATTAPPEGTALYISGWGAISEGGPGSSNLKFTVVYVKNFNTCNQQYKYGLTSRMICAADRGRDSCQGDSGGPAVFVSNGIVYLGGVVSFGYGCANPNYPGIYTNVANLRTWIRSYTGI